jgi:two-component system, chemotaxis family, sensor kinase CheA
VKILIVDDDLGFRIALQRYLVLGNHEVCLAETGEAALRVLKAEWYIKPVDLVLLDINLGTGIDGIELSRRLKEHPVLCITPVIILAAESAVDIRQRARSGLNAIESVRLILQKPIDFTMLERAISLIEPIRQEH